MLSARLRRPDDGSLLSSGLFFLYCCCCCFVRLLVLILVISIGGGGGHLTPRQVLLCSAVFFLSLSQSTTVTPVVAHCSSCWRAQSHIITNTPIVVDVAVVLGVFGVSAAAITLFFFFLTLAVPAFFPSSTQIFPISNRY